MEQIKEWSINLTRGSHVEAMKAEDDEVIQKMISATSAADKRAHQIELGKLRIRRSAQRLDEGVILDGTPANWREQVQERISLGVLDMGSPWSCVLGVTFADAPRTPEEDSLLHDPSGFSKGLYYLALGEFAAEFAFEDDGFISYEDLEVLWEGYLTGAWS